METEQKLSEKVENNLVRALKFMNRYNLTEFEFEDKETGESLQLSRGPEESSPPLLEGRSSENKDLLFSPAVGRIDWKVDSGDEVEKEEVVATIQKHREEIDVEAPRTGTIEVLVPAEPVEFGEKLAMIEPRRSETNE